MKTLLVTSLLLVLSLQAFAQPVTGRSANEPSSVNFEEPPFIMFSYDEFSDVRDVQKKAYLESFMKKVTRLPSLETLKPAQLEEASVWEESWVALMEKTYSDCQLKENDAVCRDLTQIRLDVLDLYANQKLENREAAAAQAAKSLAAH